MNGFKTNINLLVFLLLKYKKNAKIFLGDGYMHILEIKNLYVSVNDKKILKDFNLTIKSGEIHTIMGPNGVGKSTLTKVIMGDKNYQVISGQILFDGVDISKLEVDERAHLGIFLGMQHPLELDGVTNADFLRTALHAKMGDQFSLMPFIKELKQTTDQLKISREMIHRSVNRGFSGGEKKKNEILQMYMLKPNTILLDEIDSGLDVDALKVVGESVMDYYQKYNPAILLITHYERLLDYIRPQFVHVIMDGKIVKSGDASLVKLIEEKGYDYFKESKTTEVVQG